MQGAEVRVTLYIYAVSSLYLVCPYYRRKLLSEEDSDCAISTHVYVLPFSATLPFLSMVLFHTHVFKRSMVRFFASEPKLVASDALQLFN